MRSAVSGFDARKCTVRPTVPSLLERMATHVRDSHIGKLKSPSDTEEFEKCIHEHVWHARCSSECRFYQGFAD